MPEAAQFFQGVEPRRRGRHLDHPIAMPGRPFAPQLDVLGDALLVRRSGLRIFQQRIQLEAHVAVVAARFVPRRQENLLGIADQTVGQLPGDLRIVQALLDQLIQPLIEAAGLDEVADDDGIRGRTGGADARFDRTRSGSIESSQSFVPQATRDSRGVMAALLIRIDPLLRYRIRWGER